MTENGKLFLQKLSQDAELSKKISTMDKEQFLAAAQELGFELNEKDFAPPEGDLSDDELAGVAGAKKGSGGCGCLLAGGGGGKDLKGDTYGCACVGYGHGTSGRAHRDDDELLVNCICIGGGAGLYAD